MLEEHHERLEQPRGHPLAQVVAPARHEAGAALGVDLVRVSVSVSVSVRVRVRVRVRVKVRVRWPRLGVTLTTCSSWSSLTLTLTLTLTPNADHVQQLEQLGGASRDDARVVAPG